jgi:pimeloyl-ACP methyl ester carboxylesterase
MGNLQPFTIHVSDDTLDFIRRRVRDYRWDALPDAGGWHRGTEIAFLRELCDHWLAGYDWRAQEAALNRFPQFTAEVSGVRLRFWHVKGKGPAPQPLLLLHGWPSSAFEFQHLIEPLTQPERFGGDAADAFDVVVPCLPGFGFSGRPAEPLGPRAFAALFDELMTGVLGYRRYLAQGGDWGSITSSWLGFEHGDACRGIHLNMVPVQAAGSAPRTEEERAWAERMQQSLQGEGAYAQLQATKPQSLAFAMMDSPVGIAAWIVEKFAAWSDLPRAADGRPDLRARYSLDQLLTNVMFYVATDSFATSCWPYHVMTLAESARGFLPDQRCETPTGVAVFPDPVFPTAPRSIAERSYHIVRWTEMPRGGHFAAQEEPQLLLEDVRAFARGLR